MSTLSRPSILAALAATLAITACARTHPGQATRAGALDRPGLTPPPTPRHAIHERFHGVTVIDDYRWLESPTDSTVRAWSVAQSAYARAVLDRTPNRGAIRERLAELFTGVSSSYSAMQYRDGLLFALKSQPPKEQALLVTLASPNDLATERVVLDPSAVDPAGRTAIDWYAPSLDGRLVAVSLSKNGSEDGTLYVLDAATGRALADTVPRVQYPTGGGSASWNADASGIYYTRYPGPGEPPEADLHFYQQVYFHRLGTPTTSDRYVIGKEFPRIAEIALRSSHDGRYLLAEVRNGDGGEKAHYLARLGPAAGEAERWAQVTQFRDSVAAAEFGPDGSLYLLSLSGTPRGKVLRAPLDAPDLARATVAVREGEAVIQALTPAATKLYLTNIAGGPSELRVADPRAGRTAAVPIPPVSAVLEVVHTRGDSVLFLNTSFVAPPAWYLFDPSSGAVRRTALATSAPADFSDAEVVRAYATSKDGTKVPLSIIRRKGTRLDGRNPTILSGYGGYGISVSPSFSARRRIWLDAGGVYVVANLRGGGEFGEDWHRAGNLTRKQNVFDDFIACARYLIDAGYTRPERLAIEGASNGGLLMGAALTQHPELFRAVVSYVGIYDMLRAELDPNGEFNTTEFGSVKDPAQFRALYAYSPYHHVRDGTPYPAVFLLTGENDGRVNPAHSRKMAARLQAATSSSRPVLLWTSATAGHGIGTALSERIAQQTDVFAFLFGQLGVDYRYRPSRTPVP